MMSGDDEEAPVIDGEKKVMFQCSKSSKY